jgi:hypothetical protein
MTANPLVFVSYSQADDNYENGALRSFRDTLSCTIQFVGGSEIAIFSGEADVEIGQPVQNRISQSLDEAMILVPLLTPSFFQDPTCQNILARFLEREQSLGRKDLVLAVCYQHVPDLYKPQTTISPLVGVIAQRCLLDWRPLRGKDLDDLQVRQKLESLAKRIIGILKELQAVAPNTPLPTEHKDFSINRHLYMHSDKEKQPAREDITMNQFDKLRDWSDKLVDAEFRDMIRSLLSPTEQANLPRPVESIDRGAFLGQMQIYQRLNQAEQYLCKRYPDRFGC